MSIKNVLVKSVIFVFLALLALFVLVPLVWTFSGSLKKQSEIFADLNPLSWRAFVPSNWSVENYKLIFKRFPLLVFLRNSVIVTLLTTGIGLFVNSLAAYGLARFRFPGRQAVFVMTLVAMMLPFEVLVIPLYLLCRALRLIDTYYALILPGIVHPLSIFLLRQFIMDIPASLEESARVDGASYFRIYWSIILPLCKPALITAGLSHFILTWNAFFWPLIAVNKSDLIVYQVGIVFFKNDILPQWNELFAASVIGIFPILVIFVLLQRYFVKGIALTGVKE
jgi:ABC-type glycerol-3-phosphate transport system permease component